MPALDKPLSQLKEYKGISPKPADFDAYWARALADLDATDPAPELRPFTDVPFRNLDAFELRFTGVGGSRVYAKYLRPKQRAKASPALLCFHGYAGSFFNWSDYAGYASEGFCVAAMDCRGQGGRSEDMASVRGNTLRGHIIRGLDDHPDKLYFRNVFLDTVQLARVVAAFDEVDADKLCCMGGSQGGALSIACAALESRIRRCVSYYPFLSDYRRTWEMDLYKNAYEELSLYFRMFDPLHKREEEIFERLGYIDVKNLAPRIQGHVFMALTLMDNICPPSTQFAVYNNIVSEKECRIYPDFRHEIPPGLPDETFRFLGQLLS